MSDALITSLEPFWESLSSVRDIQEAIDKTAVEKPCLKELILQTRELDIPLEELFQLVLSLKLKDA